MFYVNLMEVKMKLFKNPAVVSLSFLSLAFGVTIAMSAIILVEFAFSFTKSVPVPSPDAFPVRIFMAPNHYLANQSKDIYLVDLSGRLLFFKPSIGLQLYSGFYKIIIWGCLSLIIYLTRNIIKATVKGDPFVKENLKRIRIIGAIFMIVPFALQAWRNYLISSLISTINVENVRLTASNSNEIVLISLAAGLFFLALSEVFRIGASLKEENELTV